MNKTIAERVLDVLRASAEPLSVSEIVKVGGFQNERQVAAAVWAMSAGDDRMLYRSEREMAPEQRRVVADNGYRLHGEYEYAIVPRPSNQTPEAK